MLHKLPKLVESVENLTDAEKAMTGRFDGESIARVSATVTEVRVAVNEIIEFLTEMESAINSAPKQMGLRGKLAEKLKSVYFHKVDYPEGTWLKLADIAIAFLKEHEGRE